MPNATLSGKLRGRGGEEEVGNWGYDTDISPKQGERKAGREEEGVKAENLLQFRDIFDLSSPEPTVTITQSERHKFQAYQGEGLWKI